MCGTLLYAICVKDAREINSNRFNAAPISFMLCSCTQALLINNFQSDQKSHLIFVPSPLPCPPSASVNCSSDMCMPRLSPPPPPLTGLSSNRPGRQAILLLSVPFVVISLLLFHASYSFVVVVVVSVAQPAPSLSLYLSLSLFAPMDSCFCCLTRNFTCRRAKIIHSKKVALIYD